MIRISSKFTSALGAAALAMSFGFAASQAQAEDVTIKHVQGEATIKKNPSKVLSFDLATLDNLDRLGITVQGAPSAVIPDYLSKYTDASVVKVGTLFEPDYETVNAAEPDLIIVAGRSAPKLPELVKIAPTIDLTVTPTNFMGDVKANVEKLGTIFGKEDEAKAEITKLDADIAALKAKAADKGTGLMVMTNGGKISAYGLGSRFGMLHSEFGVKPANDNIEVGGHGQPVTSEFILETNPDWLFVLDRDVAVGLDGNSAKQVLDNELIRQTNAWKKDQVVYLNSQNWYLVGGGLTALHSSIDQLSEAFDKAK